MGHLNMTELFEFPPILTNVLADFLSDRPKVGGRSTARSSAGLRSCEESEVVSAGGQRGCSERDLPEIDSRARETLTGV